MKLSFHGAAGEVTGSRFLVQGEKSRLLVDCGLFQGHRREARIKNEALPFEPASLDAVVVTHAHLDHCGAVPLMSARGFEGPIFATPSTADLCRIMLLDSAHIQEEDAKFFNKIHAKDGQTIEPLYGRAQAELGLSLFRAKNYGTEFSPAPGLKGRLLNAGHIMGSAMLLLQEGSRRLLFTGDLGRSDSLLLRPPLPPTGVTDLIIETTYGGRLHSPRAEGERGLAAAVWRAAETGGKLLIPSFALARTQEIVFLLARLLRKGHIPGLPVFVDSPMASAVTDIFARHASCPSLAPAALQEARLAGALKVRYIGSAEESKALNRQAGPMIIISASGMCEGGRILHHLRNNLSLRKTGILLVGFQAQGTLGRRLLEGARSVRIYGESFKVAARVSSLDSLSAHADQEDLLKFVLGLKPLPKRVFLVHGQEEERSVFRALLEAEGLTGVVCPALGETVRL
jgi:metallo-beta-lactamase family protein